MISADVKAKVKQKEVSHKFLSGVPHQNLKHSVKWLCVFIVTGKEIVWKRLNFSLFSVPVLTSTQAFCTGRKYSGKP